MSKNETVYEDKRYSLGKKDGIPFLTVDGKTYNLTCHPYEPCLYITDENGSMTAVHNAFDPLSVLWVFKSGKTITSITGFEYDALDFCRMVEYAADMVNIGIEVAERVFGGRAKKKNPEPEDKKKKDKAPDGGVYVRPEAENIIYNDPALDVISEYPDVAVDYCLVKGVDEFKRYNAHWFALVWACRHLFVDDEDEAIWHYDVGKADAAQISADELFAPVDKNGELNYRRAFLHPPYGDVYGDADFDRVNSSLFPNGTDSLEVFKWTTDWSEYFAEGREWWGALCLTVYDASLKRFVVILASATD